MNFLLYYRTISNLKPVQIWSRLPVFRKTGRRVSKESLNLAKAGAVEGWIPSIYCALFYQGRYSFIFLNRSHTFKEELDWDFEGHGLLWTYNLNYFEFLEQPDMDTVTGYSLIDNFLKQYPALKTGHDPYPISLRLIFWIRFFLRRGGRPEERYLTALHEQAKELQVKLEYHLLGNHLLENAYALFFTGAYLGDEQMTRQAKRLLQKQLNEQVLDDGAHFELSPMYHHLMLYRLLDVINMGRACRMEATKDILPFLERKAAAMLGWMLQMCFSDGTFPLFNDAAYGISPDPQTIGSYAKRLNIAPDVRPLGQSGYRKWQGKNWEMIIDAGRPGPAYQPGHAHCDALSFVLQVNEKPVLVDTGVSVYGGNATRRMEERSTSSHNTVQIGSVEQSEIWGDFRIGRLANVNIKKESLTNVEVCLNGFFPYRSIHTRSFMKSNNSIRIIDDIRVENMDCPLGVKAYLHFHPSVNIEFDGVSGVLYDYGEILFEGASEIEEQPYYFAPEFGELVTSTRFVIKFDKTLTTILKFKN